jgi:hypothetical protein
MDESKNAALCHNKKILWSNTNFPEHQDVLAADEEVGEKCEGDGSHIEVSSPHRLIRLCKPRER